MRKKLFIKVVLIAGILLIGYSCPVFARPIMSDSFTDMTKIDIVNTTADIDITAVDAENNIGEIRLKARNMANAIALKNDFYEYAVVTLEGEDFYTYDDFTKVMEKDSSRSITGVADVIGIAMKQDSYSIWLLKADELRRYDYADGMMKFNPHLSVSGISNAVALSSHPSDDTVAVLSKSASGTGIVTVYSVTGGIFTAVKIFDTGKINPVAISIVSGTEDIIVATDTCVYYYSNSGSGYIEDPDMSITSGLSSIKSVSALDDGYGYLVGMTEKIAYYICDEISGKMTEITGMTVTSEDMDGQNIISVCGKTNNFEYVAILMNTDSRYYIAGEQEMIENTQLAKSGIAAAGGYKSSGIYLSQEFTSPSAIETIRLDVWQDIPAGTDVRFSISYDGGVIWSPINPGIETNIVPATSFRIMAELTTTDVSRTPRIFNVVLEALSEEPNLIPPDEENHPIDMTIIQKISSYSDLEDPEYQFKGVPVAIKAGAQAVFEVKTIGSVDSVEIELSAENYVMVIDANEPEHLESLGGGVDRWIGVYTIPIDVPQGTEIYFDRVKLVRNGVSYYYGETGRQQWNGDENIYENEDIPFLVVEGSTLDDHEVQLTE